MTGGSVVVKSSKRPQDGATDEEGQLMDGERATVAPPPDGGWGWVVVFASFMIHIIADGVTYTFGIFFVELANYFEGGKGATSWIASILVGVTLGSGPLASALTNKYGCRAVTIVGTFIASVGFIISLFATNVATLYFTIGICVGLGFGLIYLPAIVSVTCYFEKRRAFATGIAVCGSGLGTFIFAPLTEYLVDLYGWKGAMLLVAGVVLNCAVFGALFRSPNDTRGSHRRRHRAQSKLNATPQVDNRAPPATCPTTPGGRVEPERVKILRRSETANGHLVSNGGGDIDADNNRINLATSPNHHHRQNGGQLLHNGYLSLSVQLQQEAGVKSVSAHDLAQMALAASAPLRLAVLDGSSSQSLVWKEAKALAAANAMTTPLPPHQHPHEPFQGPLYRKDVFYRGSLLNIPQYRSNPSMYTASITHIPSPEPTPATPSKMPSCCSREAMDALKEMMDLSLLADPVFLLFAVSNFCTSIGFNVPYVYIKDRAMLLGLSGDDSSFLLAIIGISNTISRVLLGYVSDKTWLNRLWLYNCALIICGLSTAFSAFCLDYPSQAFYTAVFGATAGAYVGLTSVILVDLLGLEKLTNAFGLLLLFQGIASLIGPPIAGWLYDGLGSYNPGFAVAGVMIALSGAMLFAIPLVKRCSGKDADGMAAAEVATVVTTAVVLVAAESAPPADDVTV